MRGTSLEGKGGIVGGVAGWMVIVAAVVGWELVDCSGSADCSTLVVLDAEPGLLVTVAPSSTASPLVACSPSTSSSCTGATSATVSCSLLSSAAFGLTIVVSSAAVGASTLITVSGSGSGMTEDGTKGGESVTMEG